MTEFEKMAIQEKIFELRSELNFIQKNSTQFIEDMKGIISFTISTLMDLLNKDTLNMLDKEELIRSKQSNENTEQN